MIRKISPHVQIYKFPLTALTSITTRLTGLYLTGIFTTVGIYQFTNNNDYLINKYQKLENYQKLLIIQ